jgi:cytochrome c-type biogenesis protein
MTELLVGLMSALWLGILTSISPCPLATNIAAISFVSKKVTDSKRVFFAGLLYTFGRVIAYIILGAILVSSLLSAPTLSHFLQKYMNQFLGPVLILVGMVLLELISFNLSGFSLSQKFQDRVGKSGVWGAFPLGLLFAFSFCPTSAALFFGSLIPVALKAESTIIIPAVYGVGTGLPVLIFAVLVAFGAKSLSKSFNKIVAFELWARRITGVIFIGVGIYYCLVHIFGLL